MWRDVLDCVTRSLLSSSLYANAARAGLTARAIVYWLVAGLMIRAALLPQEGEDGYSPGDAFRALETQPAGRIVLLVIGAGLLTYAVWRFIQGIMDVRKKGDDAGGRFARLGMLSSGVSYGLLGVAAIAVTFGSNSGSGAGATETTAQWLLERPFGRFAVFAFGAALMAIGVAQVVRTFTDSWQDDLALSGWRRKLIAPIEISIIGRGILFVLVGGFLAIGGWTEDPGDVRGLSATLLWLRQMPLGFWLYLGGALVIAGYGLYSAVQARCLEFRC